VLKDSTVHGNEAVLSSAINCNRGIVSIFNTVFKSNTWTSWVGASKRDLNTIDDEDPNGDGGSYMYCDRFQKALFCDGVQGIYENNYGLDNANTNCFVAASFDATDPRCLALT
jgi:hypothetical protein